MYFFHMYLFLKKNMDELMKSLPSLQSESLSSHSGRLTVENFKNTERHEFFYLDGEACVAIKHKCRPRLEENDYKEIRKVDKKINTTFWGVKTL